MKTLEQIKIAFENSEFYLEYMPTMSLLDHRCVGAEALIRWRATNELILPDEFIPVVENTPMAGSITYWIIEQIAQDLGDWLHSTSDVHIGINVPPEILGRGGLQYAVQNAGMMEVVDKLILEITERGYPDQLALDSLKLRGDTKVAIDDFGTGDANIMQLSQMEADIIKLDKFFVDQITDQQAIPKIVKGLVAFAKGMDFEIIAEGVETQIQVDVLRSLGVEMGQGWYFSKPLTVDAFIEYFNAA